MTKEDLARQLNGLEYPAHITRDVAQAAKEAGLVIIYGASDDLLELRGAIDEEIGACGGGEILITPDGLWVPDACESRCRYYRAAEKSARRRGQTITALWDPGDGYSWRYATQIPHATFEITCVWRAVLSRINI